MIEPGRFFGSSLDEYKELLRLDIYIYIQKLEQASRYQILFDFQLLGKYEKSLKTFFWVVTAI